MSSAVRIEVCDGSRETTVGAGSAYLAMRRGALTTTFAYADAFVASSDAWALSPDLPLTGRSVTSGLPGALADTAPDRWGRRLIDRRIRGEALVEGRTRPSARQPSNASAAARCVAGASACQSCRRQASRAATPRSARLSRMAPAIAAGSAPGAFEVTSSPTA